MLSNVNVIYLWDSRGARERRRVYVVWRVTHDALGSRPLDGLNALVK